MTDQQGQENRPNGREKLLWAAIKQFAQNGFDGTSVKDLADEAGVSTGLIRKYYGSKQGLHDAADAYVMARLRSYNLDILGESLSTGPNEFSQTAERFVQQEGGLLAAYLRYVLGDPAARGKKLIENYRQQFVDQVALLREQGVLAEGIDDHWLAYTLMFLQMGPMMLEPYAETLDGVSLYDADQTRARNVAYFNLLKAVFKSPPQTQG